MKLDKLGLVGLLTVALIPFSNCFAQSKLKKDTFLFTKYGSQELYLDRYVDPSLNDKRAKKPVFVFLFGGGWEGGSRNVEEAKPFFNELTAKGYTVVAIDYRLYIREAKSKGLMNAQNGTQLYLKAIDIAVEDLYAATRYILDHATEWNIDPQQIVIGGGSSGATSSVVAEYGICNSTPLAQNYLPADFNYAGVISMAGALWLAGENTKSVWPKKPCPFLFFIGNKDQVVTYNDSHVSGFAGYGAAYLSKQFTDMGVANWFYDYVDGDHLIAAEPIINKRDEISIFLKQFVARKKQLYLHTIENGKVPIDFSHAATVLDIPK